MAFPLITLARLGWLMGMVDLGRLGKNYYTLVFRGAGITSEILPQLANKPATAADLASQMGFDPTMVDGLEAWLDAGVAFGELAKTGSTYRIHSRGLKRVLKPSNDPVAAFTEELAGLHYRLLAETPQRLRTGERFQIGDADPSIIARSSRVGEPWIRGALERHIPRSGVIRVLEVGCGSGIHMKTVADLNGSATVTGIELSESAATIARSQIDEWGLNDRLTVTTQDIRDYEAPEPFDLITLHQNIYYFTDDQQVDLLRQLRTLVRSGGKIIVTTVVRGTSMSSAGLDLWGAMTDGASRLPIPGELTQRMLDAGFASAAFEKLGMDGLYGAFVGRA